ncbi:MAG TPA: DUF6077 domain-containing protein [Ornithinibacter sp.]|nr:DUF6077 domain-containing protein [Ornithinibacter sp.]
MTLSTLPERAGRSVVTGTLVLFAVWTLVYQVALFTGFPATPSLAVAAVLGVAALVGLSRLRPGDRRDHVGFPGATAALAVVSVALLATVLAVAGLRLAALALGVVSALVALVMSSRWAPRLESLRRFRAEKDDAPVEAEADDAGDDPASGAGRTASAPWLWATGWLVALVSGGLAAIIASPDGDDAYFVNLSTWVAERGNFPLRDTMISSDVFPAIQGHSPPVHSIEGLIGSIARVLGLEAGTVTYVVVPPLVTALAVLVLTLLVAEAGIPAAPVALLAAAAYLWTAGRTGYGMGGFFAVRIWQGKAMLAAVALPLVFLHGARLMRHRSARDHALFAAALVASIGVSNTAAFLVPVLVAGLVLGALAQAQWRGALRLSVWTLYPAAMGVLSVALAPAGPTRAQLLAAGFDLAPITDTIDPVLTVPGSGGMLVVTALAIGVGALGIGNRAMRLGAAGAIVTGGLALLPPVRDVLRDLGLWSVVWRMWWAIPITLLLAGTVGAAAHWARGRRMARVAVGATALLVALVPLVDGRWVGDPRNDARWVDPLDWKVPDRALQQARAVERISDPGDVVLVPANTARALAALTVDIHPVSARPFYLPNYAGTPAAHAGARRTLQQFVDVTTPDDPTAIEDALTLLDVRTVCLRNHRGGGIRLLQADGFRVVEKKAGNTCLQR